MGHNAATTEPADFLTTVIVFVTTGIASSARPTGSEQITKLPQIISKNYIYEYNTI